MTSNKLNKCHHEDLNEAVSWENDMDVDFTTGERFPYVEHRFGNFMSVTLPSWIICGEQQEESVEGGKNVNGIRRLQLTYNWAQNHFLPRIAFNDSRTLMMLVVPVGDIRMIRLMVFHLRPFQLPMLVFQCGFYGRHARRFDELDFTASFVDDGDYIFSQFWMLGYNDDFTKNDIDERRSRGFKRFGCWSRNREYDCRRNSLHILERTVFDAHPSYNRNWYKVVHYPWPLTYGAPYPFQIAVDCCEVSFEIDRWILSDERDSYGSIVDRIIKTDPIQLQGLNLLAMTMTMSRVSSLEFIKFDKCRKGLLMEAMRDFIHGHEDCFVCYDTYATMMSKCEVDSFINESI